MPNFRDPYTRWGDDFDTTDLSVEFVTWNEIVRVACMNGILRMSSPSGKVSLPPVNGDELLYLMKNDLA